ncbi:MAG: hypothetical protein KDB27_30230 [Planctomycetales bacterium]|nr:hypothetical protein [Planctomycetales bacterium]
MSQLVPAQPSPSAANHFCRKCGQAFGRSDNFCGGCGSPNEGTLVTTAITPALAESRNGPSNQISISLNPSLKKALNNRWIVGLILLTVGPMGLPALWMSDRFSLTSKVVTSTVFLLLTAAIPIAITWYWLDTSMQPLVEAMSNR